MAEAEEIRSRIETIKDLSDRLAEQDRTIKDLEEEMRSETPEHPWSFMKMRRHNRLHTEIEDEQTSMSRDRYDLNHLAERLFEDVNIIADKATSTNSLELILDLVEQSLDTDPKYRENVRKQAGVTDGMSYMRLVPQDNPKGMLPPTPWGRKAAEEAYRQHQVRQLDQRLRLLRTLATGSYKNHDTPETNDYLALMDFNGAYSHRWIVSGHFRNQAVGQNWSEHRVIWIPPYVAGPAGKPLVIKEKVTVIR